MIERFFMWIDMKKTNEDGMDIMERFGITMKILF
jgi:hypothetical protein|uniref:Uncharacterized protein n=1 Tax=Podoviridae sp. ctuQh21 TaxID=2825284 RepID=A0A8S5PG17_9CAUD|nr:MAG TPA: hypothetical protein [Podoviridae sp. ctuQh21]DAT13933.1 MAG TPA: hypothetical protein [Caudoviricetes sp.]